MRDPRARMALIGLILAFPLVMTVLSPARPAVRDVALPLFAVEAVLVGGLMVAGRERLRLHAERTAAAAAPARRAVFGVPHAAPRAVRRAHAGRLS